MAIMHQPYRCIQYHLLESPFLQSTLSLLHVQVFEEDRKGRWNFVVYNRIVVF
ncbi:hypothetical protein RHGRI_032833 [Rhododendron griersonianum]|uniref:Uncharacterized protein n=1 Tax=Rhododendron griersonianum TaxID=479676 RepID=A0AAV6IH58_9ERIC|nr:hypothetical protein RHGRI_032833 [Rhododendron griersonianum]